jgi:hypothetical protein
MATLSWSAGAAASGWANEVVATIAAQAASVSFRKVVFMMNLPHKDSRAQAGLETRR